MSARLDQSCRSLLVDVPAHKIAVDVDEVLPKFPEDALLDAYLKKRGTQRRVGVKLMPAEKRRVIENAYLAAKRLADLPNEIKDLFWIVHGRALP